MSSSQVIRNNRRNATRRRKSVNNRVMGRRPVMNISGSSFNGFVFPERLRANFRFALNNIHTYNTGANTNTTLSLSNGISVYPGNNISGLAWLLSGQQTNGTSNAPYSLAVIRKAKIEVYAKVVTTATGNASALLVVYPLSYGVSSSGLTLTNAEEQFGRSSIIELPLSFDTVPHRRPMITKNYNVWDLIGIDEATYMSSLDEHSFNYNGMLTTATSQYVTIQTGVESGLSDATLAVRLNIIVEMEIEFYARNGAIVNSPHS